MEEAERGAKKIESAVVMVTVSAINIVGRRKRNHRKKQNQATQPMLSEYSDMNTNTVSDIKYLNSDTNGLNFSKRIQTQIL